VPLLARPAVFALSVIRKHHATTSESPLLLVAVGGGLRARGMAEYSSERATTLRRSTARYQFSNSSR